MLTDIQTVIIAISAATLSGVVATIIRASFDQKTAKRKEEIHSRERRYDQLQLELRDLKLQLYALEKDLDECKDKYYETLSQSVEIKAALEHALNALSMTEFKAECDE